MRYPRFGYRRIQVFLGRPGLAVSATGRTASGSARGCRCLGDGQAIPRMREPARERGQARARHRALEACRAQAAAERRARGLRLPRCRPSLPRPRRARRAGAPPCGAGTEWPSRCSRRSRPPPRSACTARHLRSTGTCSSRRGPAVCLRCRAAAARSRARSRFPPRRRTRSEKACCVRSTSDTLRSYAGSRSRAVPVT